MRKSLLNILFWSLISAAFIGPGTVTTAASAGASFRFQLIWALVFSTFACLILQEAVARISIVSGKNLGQALWERYRGKTWGQRILVLVCAIIIFGCLAFEAGNILGAAAGFAIVSEKGRVAAVLAIGLLAGLVLLLPSLQAIGRLLGIIVGIMGMAFLATSVLLKPEPMELLRGAFLPVIPREQGSLLLVLGLVGTTVVPYNLFLGSGMAHRNDRLKEMRLGLSVAVILGGIISISVLITGSSIREGFSFISLAEALAEKLGSWAVYLFALGLSMAGFTSAITAPLASAVTAGSIFGNLNPSSWEPASKKFRMTWMLVLGTGLLFGLFSLRPVPVIILAQALNGMVLPVITVFIVILLNDTVLLGKDATNSLTQNILLGLVAWVSIFLGIFQLIRVLHDLMNPGRIMGRMYICVAIIASLIICIVLWHNVLYIRNKMKKANGSTDARV